MTDWASVTAQAAGVWSAVTGNNAAQDYAAEDYFAGNYATGGAAITSWSALSIPATVWT